MVTKNKTTTKKNSKRLNETHIEEVVAVLNTLKVKNYSNLARAMGRDDSALRVYCLKYGIAIDAFAKKKPIRAPAIVGEVFKIADAKGMKLKDIAALMGNHTSTVGNWRRGNSSCSAFALECIAGIVGARLIVEPITSESNSQ